MLQFQPTMLNPSLYPDTSNRPTMLAENWFSTSEFEDMWKTAFSDAKSAFPGLPEDVKPRQKCEKGGALWTELRKPSPGVHLLAIEFRTEVYSLSIRLKVWIDQHFPELYASLRSGKTPNIAGQKTVLFPDEEPRPSWKNQLKAKGITLLGLNYKVSDLSFLNHVDTAESKLQKMAAEFFEWLIDRLASTEAPSSDSKSTNEPSSEGYRKTPLPSPKPAMDAGKAKSGRQAQPAQDRAPDNAPGAGNLNQLLNWEKALAAVTQLGGTASRSQVEAWILEGDPSYNTSNLVDLYMMSVNSPARVGYSHNREPRRTDQGNRYDQLFKVGEAIFELYDPAQHGIWEIYSSS